MRLSDYEVKRSASYRPGRLDRAFAWTPPGAPLDESAPTRAVELTNLRSEAR